MKNLILLAVMILTAFQSFAQCTGTIPSDAIAIQGDDEDAYFGNGLAYWVCNDAMGITFTGNNNRIFVESGATVSVVGDTNRIWYKSTTIPLVLYGVENEIYAEVSGMIDFQGPLGGVTTVAICGMANGVIFNYQTAPIDGCLTVGYTDPALIQVSIFPNPVQDVLFIQKGNTQIERIDIHDAQGVPICSYTGSMDRIPLTGLANGAYTARVFLQSGILTSRFVKM